MKNVGVRIAIGAVALTILGSCASAAGTLARVKDASGVADGTYRGASFDFPVSVEVEVEIAARRMERIDILRHFNGRGKPAEAIVGRVLEKQSLEVDAVGGATHSSRVILEAVADALSKGRPEE